MWIVKGVFNLIAAGLGVAFIGGVTLFITGLILDGFDGFDRKVITINDEKGLKIRIALFCLVLGGLFLVYGGGETKEEEELALQIEQLENEIENIKYEYGEEIENYSDKIRELKEQTEDLRSYIAGYEEELLSLGYSYDWLIIG